MPALELRFLALAAFLQPHKVSCHVCPFPQVSLRKQELEDRLSAWAVFSEKNKELCAWLVQMESKVLQSVDVSIEDMIDKLQKVGRFLQAPVSSLGPRFSECSVLTHA